MTGHFYCGSTLDTSPLDGPRERPISPLLSLPEDSHDTRISRAVPGTASTADIERTARFLRDIRERVARVVVGQDVVVERLLIALLTGGHLLLQGVPGLAKTLLVAVLSKTIDLAFARIQFTIDLLPSDILGSEILDPRTN